MFWVLRITYLAKNPMNARKRFGFIHKQEAEATLGYPLAPRKFLGGVKTHLVPIRECE